MGVLRPLFRGLTGVALASAMTLPALAQDVANDAPVVKASMGTTITGQALCEKWATQASGLFPVVCADSMSEEAIIQGAKDSSHNQLMLIVWGGNDALRLEGIKLIHGMHKEGKNVAIAFGPDRDGSANSAEFEVYANGGRALQFVENIGVNNIDQISTVLSGRVESAYSTNFPRKVASNQTQTYAYK